MADLPMPSRVRRKVEWYLKFYPKNRLKLMGASDG